MLLPESAFISNFLMTFKEEEYVAEVKEKKEAKRTYEEAVNSGLSAGLVSKNRRDSNTFSVDTNLEPGEKVVFTLTYEELLERTDDQYEYVLHVDPGVVLDDFRVEININESLPLSQQFVPELLESNEIDFSKEEEESSIAEVTRDVGGSPNNARVVFAPSKEYQLEAGDQGVSGRFVVRYDVDRQGQHSEVQVIDGYFVHYFAPFNLPSLPKHVVFVLDTSGSMSGEKIQQLKDAMFTVLEDLTESDFFNMIEFNSGVNHWRGEGFSGSNTEIYPATEENKNKAIKSVIELSAGGGTNLNAAILAGLEVVETALQREALPKDVKSLVVFLTDGLPSEGVTQPDSIKTNIKTKNRELQTPVFTVAFGADTDLSLLQSIASQNNAISKRIYKGSDAALQLEDFYAEISTPLLSNIKVQYTGGVEESSLSETQLNTFFKRKEFLVTGKLSDLRGENLRVNITGLGKAGLPYHSHFDICLRSLRSPNTSSTLPSCLKPRVFPKSEAQNFLQKLFAFQHIKQVLKKENNADNEKEKSKLRDRATELSLENNLVTEVTSLVVVKPGEQPQVRNPAKILIEQEEKGMVRLRSRTRTTGSGLLGAGVSFGSLRSRLSAVGGTSSLSGISKPRRPTRRRNPSSRSRAPSRSRTPSSTTNSSTASALECVGEGRLVLYSKTYHRGDQLELSQSQSDLTDHQFGQSAVSAVVTGDCCWQLYSGPNYSGEEEITVRPGMQYTSVTSLATLFRSVTSVRKIQC